MENNNPSSGQPASGQSPDPNAMPDPIGPVVLTRDQYEELQRRANAAPVAVPAGSPAPVSAVSATEALSTGAGRKNLIGLIFVAVLLLSFLIPGLGILTFPIIVFGVMAALGFFKDATAGRPGQPTHPVVWVLRILLAIGVSILIGLGAIVAFFVLLFTAGGGRGT